MEKHRGGGGVRIMVFVYSNSFGSQGLNLFEKIFCARGAGEDAFRTSRRFHAPGCVQWKAGKEGSNRQKGVNLFERIFVREVRVRMC
jgi:hypothetical protein